MSSTSSLFYLFTVVVVLSVVVFVLILFIQALKDAFK